MAERSLMEQLWIAAIIGGLIALVALGGFILAQRRRTKRGPERHDIYPLW